MTDEPLNRAFDPDKARRVARDPDRPGERCRAEPGCFVPHVNPARCEAKGECEAVCPYRVFAVRPTQAADFARMSWLGKLRNLAHGKRLAYTPHADDCRACGLCVVACPEQAIELGSTAPASLE